MILWREKKTYLFLYDFNENRYNLDVIYMLFQIDSNIVIDLPLICSCIQFKCIVLV